MAVQIRVFLNCLILTVTPVTILIGLYGLISFGSFLMQATMQATFLLQPTEEHGYGFKLAQLAESKYRCSSAAISLNTNKLSVSISGWIGVLAAVAYTQFVSDRLPLAICKRRGGVWRNEYRLQCMWLPGLIVLPIGLGLFGAAVKYHWSPALLALSYFMTTAGSCGTTSIITNYLIECFIDLPAECGVVLSGYRLLFGLATGFFIAPWSEAVGVAWAFGTAAFLSVLAMAFIGLLVWKGPLFRAMQLADLGSSKEGSKLMR